MRLSPKNAKFLRDVSQICADFTKYLKQHREGKEKPIDVIEVLCELDLYRIDFAKLLEFFYAVIAEVPGGLLSLVCGAFVRTQS